MVFKPFGALARQSFAKHFTNGYAQSAVAAAQSSYASSTAFPLVRVGHSAVPAKTQAGFGGAHAGRTDYSSSTQRVHDSLSPYYTTFTQNHDDDGQWRQFQYPKRILWSPASPGQQQKEGTSATDDSPSAGKLKPRAASMSSVREFSTSATAQQEANIRENGSEEAILDVQTEPTSEQVEVNTAPAGEDVKALNEQATGLTGSTLDIALEFSTIDEDATEVASPLRSETEDTFVESSTAADDAVSDYLQLFEESKNQGQFDQIIEGFNHMLSAGVRPSTETYNYLLHAITQIEGFGHVRISRLLDIYNTMTQQKTPLSSYTFSILIYALCDWLYRARGILREKEIQAVRFDIDPPRSYVDMTARYHDADSKTRALLHGIQTSEKPDLPWIEYSPEECVRLSIALLKDAFATGKTDIPWITYNRLVKACADADRMDDVIIVLEKMESINLAPDTDAMQSMITCFGRMGDMNSAIDCFTSAVTEKSKPDVDLSSLNTALVEAYFTSGNSAQGLQFAAKLTDGSAPSTEVCITIASRYLEDNDLEAAIQWTEGFGKVELGSRAHELLRDLCLKAADLGNKDIAIRTVAMLADSCLRYLSKNICGAIIAMHIRQQDTTSAMDFFLTQHNWDHVETKDRPLLLMLGQALVKQANLDEGMEDFCRMIIKIKLSTRMGAEELIAPIVDYLESNQLLSQKQSLTLMRLYEIKRYPMSASIGQKLLIPFEGVPLESLTLSDFHLMVLPQSSVTGDANATPEDVEKLTKMLELAQQYQLPLWNFPATMIENLPAQPLQNLDLEFAEWEKRNWEFAPLRPKERSDQNSEPLWQLSSTHRMKGRFDSFQAEYHWSHEPSFHLPTFDSNKLFDEFDPYESTVDLRKSTELSSLLDRQAGTPQYAKSNKSHQRGYSNDYVQTVLPLTSEQFVIQPTVVARALAVIARSEDVPAKQRIEDLEKGFRISLKQLPLMKEYRKSRYAWYLMHDAMIAACLSLGYMDGASRYHRDMLGFGASPSANTYGLYIVNLKGSHETFDEASEALAIFERAKNEGVVPTSFLYNALIGKLAKARRIDDCLFYFSEMRALGIRPTSITYGTIVNALCRVSDERFAEELFAEMETMPNYKPRAAPYNSIIQFFVNTKRDRKKALKYYEQMVSLGIRPSAFTFKLLIEAHATCDPPQIDLAKEVFTDMALLGIQPQAIHYAALIHARGCVLGDLEGARAEFNEWHDQYLASNNNSRGLEPVANCYQALCEAMVANHKVDEAVKLIEDMKKNHIFMTPYIANSLIHGHAVEGQIDKAKEVYDSLNLLGSNRREPSTYEAMAKAHISVGDHDSAVNVINEMASRSYPAPVMARVIDLLRGGGTHDVQYVH